MFTAECENVSVTPGGSTRITFLGPHGGGRDSEQNKRWNPYCGVGTALKKEVGGIP